MPYPDRAALEAMDPGWAVAISVNLMQQLHEGSNTELPNYLKS